jgi:putative peptidoglycan lipid II flippase
MNHSKLPVSVIIPCYCSSDTIERAVDSVVNQSAYPSELFLIDDGSKDNGKTLNILNKLKDKYIEEFDIHIISLPENRGPSYARNIAWNQSSKEYVAFLDADDAWHPDKLKIQYEWMHKHQDYALTCHEYTLKNDWGNVELDEKLTSYYEVTFKKLIFRNPFSTPNVMLRRDISVRFSENKKYGEDYDLWLRLITSGYKAAFLKTCLTRLYKAPYGEAGLSSDLWEMEKGELDAYKQLNNAGNLSFIPYLFICALSFIKYFKRIAYKQYLVLNQTETDAAIQLNESKGLLNNFVIWTIFFCLSTIVALLFQKLLLPMLPSMHAGYGLLSNDAILFHNLAAKIASNIDVNGWAWGDLWSDASHMRGNVAVLAFMYSLFTPDPSLVIPFNAAIHALSGVLIFLIAQFILPGKTGRIGGLCAGTLFVILPSALNWYAQVHRDGYAILGTLVILYSWLKFTRYNKATKDIIIFIGLNIVGVALYWFVRPYYLILITIVSTITFLSVISISDIRCRFDWKSLFAFLFIYVMFCSLSYEARHDLFYSTKSLADSYNNQSKSKNIDCPVWGWEKTSWLPSIIDESAELGAKARRVLICGSKKANSNIDETILPNNFIEVLKYVPRGIQIALFAPFPDSWFSSSSLTWFVGVSEIILWYLLLPGAFILVYKKRTPEVIISLVFILSFISFFGFTTSNLGTLHRARYVYIALLMMLGILGWCSYLLNTKWIKNKSKKILSSATSSTNVFNEFLPSNENEIHELRKKAVSGGGIIALLTFVSYVGFFLRDVLMAYKFGFGDQLDAFFIAMLVPMFFVNVICQSFGAASIPAYLELKQKNNSQAKKMVQNYSKFITIVLFVLSAILVLFAPVIVGSLGWNFSSEKYDYAIKLFYAAIPVLMLSGMVVLGNSILNARMQYNIPAWSQAVVPIFAILSLVLLGDKFNVASVLIGMIFGQIVNLVLIQLFLMKNELTLIPDFKNDVNLSKESKQQFISLILASLFIHVALLVDHGMASSLISGSVASLSLGLKVVFFITGLIGAVITMVVLPYFSYYFSRADVMTARRELSMLIIIGTLLGSVISIIVFIMAEPVLNSIFSRGDFVKHEITLISNIVKMGVVQVPFFACNLILIKFATALKSNKPILISTFIGLMLNVFLNFMLMEFMGVAGIALATSLSMLVSSAIIMVLVQREGNINFIDMVYIGLTWLLYLTLIVCFYYQSYPGIIMSIMALILINYVLMNDYFSIKNQHAIEEKY